MSVICVTYVSVPWARWLVSSLSLGVCVCVCVCVRVHVHVCVCACMSGLWVKWLEFSLWFVCERVCVFV